MGTDTGRVYRPRGATTALDRTGERDGNEPIPVHCEMDFNSGWDDPGCIHGVVIRHTHFED
jgi:hypothetical protein